MPASSGRASLWLVLGLIAGCSGETPERARIVQARLVVSGSTANLDLTQELHFSRTMRDALAHGIPLRLGYRIDGCEWSQQEVFELRYVPLSRLYELQREGDAQTRRFVRRSALLAALDRIQIPLRQRPPADCRGEVAMVLDLTSLPTPLRFPALFNPGEWRMVSPTVAWLPPSPRA